MKSESLSEWEKLAQKESKGEAKSSSDTPEGIPFQTVYSQKDLDERNIDPGMPGFYPYTRGPKATMYTQRPWTIRQYAGFSTAKESNSFYKKALAGGQKGLSVAFDLATHRGYDSDHPRVLGDVGKAGVAIDSVEDMLELFQGIDLSKVSVSMTMNGAVAPILAAFIVAGEEKGVPREQLSGTIQNDILKEYMVRNTYIYPPEASMRITSDIIGFTAKNMPHFNSISISGYHMQEAGAHSALELAYTLADGKEYVQRALDIGLDIDQFAPRLSFFFAIGQNFLMEIAKLRAARMMWSGIMKNFGAKNPKSLMLRTHCQTSGYSLASKDPYNNIVRTSIEAMAAVLGGTQSLHTNSFDEALALPSELSAKIARNTQLILQNETDLLKSVDPFGGSYLMESLTLDLSKKAYEFIEEIDKLGGMTKALETGIPRTRIEESSLKKQARLDSGIDKIVGVNAYLSENHEEIPLLNIDANQVRSEQIEKLHRLRKGRDEAKIEVVLNKLKKSAGTAKEALLPLCIDAMRARATVGEVSLALEDVFGRYAPKFEALSGVYMNEMSSSEKTDKIIQRVQVFCEKTGRRPRILIAKLGQDGHDRGAKVIASAFADFGFTVDLGSLFQSSQEVAKQAIESDVHAVGISSMTGGHTKLVPDLITELKKFKALSVKVILGGIVPEKEIPFLKSKGVDLFFGPGSNIVDCANSVLDLLEDQDHG